jgi:hypothetical protein
MCMTQFHSWLQRRRQHNLSIERRKSANESKVPTPYATPKLFGSPRLARLHQKLFKTSAPSSPQMNHIQIPIQILDDSDPRSQYEHPVRIYFPPLPSPTFHHERTTDINIISSNDDNPDVQIEQTSNLTTTTPILHRKYTSSSSSSSSLKMTTAKERRESFATSNVFNKKCL